MVRVTMEQYDEEMTVAHLGADAMMWKLERLQRNAAQCRDLAEDAITAEGRKVLMEMALDYDDRAANLQVDGAKSPQPN